MSMVSQKLKNEGKETRGGKRTIAEGWKDSETRAL